MQIAIQIPILRPPSYASRPLHPTPPPHCGQPPPDRPWEDGRREGREGAWERSGARDGDPVRGHHKAVHIIESLRTNDLKTGARLRDRLGAVVEQPGVGLPVRFWREPTKAGFLDRLRQIAAEVRSPGQAPIIDLQTHGSVDGLQVTSHEIVTWSELKAPLTEINVLCRLNLLVLVGACDGEALLHALQAPDRAPVWGLI